MASLERNTKQLPQSIVRMNGINVKCQYLYRYILVLLCAYWYDLPMQNESNPMMEDKVIIFPVMRWFCGFICRRVSIISTWFAIFPSNLICCTVLHVCAFFFLFIFIISPDTRPIHYKCRESEKWNNLCVTHMALAHTKCINASW